MTKQQIAEIAGGMAHAVPADLHKALIDHPQALQAWQTITPLARNEWICWTITVKQQATRDQHVARTCKQLAEGKRRPCCWAGCMHRTNKPASPWVQKQLQRRIRNQPMKSA